MADKRHEDTTLGCCAVEKSRHFASFAAGKPCVLGIDEAGRGPVLGPMVYACAVVAFAYRVLSARFISAEMLRRCKYSLNELSHASAVHMISLALQNKVNVTEVYVDTVGPKGALQAKLQERFPSISITVTEKADSLFAVVSAASIVAKVNRDSLLREWIFVEGDVRVPLEGYGSGYPCDPLTKKFLMDSVDPVFGYSSLVRFSWKTAEVALERNAVPCKWEEPGIAQISSWFHLGPKEECRPVRHAFFNDRFISNVVSF
ncbi:unnamed protein product [Toxocara canis]|uniref:Ribonuclease n=1 Tax=Toxocara canis TaxID=6265 RepID=A0A183TW14_TOXCA|nr:unnamed protein product [Toxocara canis]